MSNKKDSDTVTKTELQILDYLWETAPQTIRELCSSMYGDTTTSYYATVQSLLDRLEKKGWVERDRRGFKHTFRPTKTRIEFIGQQIQDVADAVCGGSVFALLGQLARSQTLTPSQRRELRKLVDGGAPS